jgi:hypothetical protein
VGDIISEQAGDIISEWVGEIISEWRATSSGFCNGLAQALRVDLQGSGLGRFGTLGDTPNASSTGMSRTRQILRRC